MSGNDRVRPRPPRIAPSREDFIAGETSSIPLNERLEQVVKIASVPPRAATFDAKVGAQLGHYHLVAKIARGGMATVWMAWRAKNRGHGEVVALKTLLPHLAEDLPFVKMFLDEAKLLSDIEHPNVVAIRDVGTHEGTPYVALEWVDGDSLKTLMQALELRNKELPLAIALRIVGECCLGLHAAHEARDATGEPLGVVHRDVTPANILLSANGDVKLIDFGVAKSDMRLSENTGTGVLKGKVAYMAPEQALRRAIDRRTDVWAVGVILYRLITGRLPWEGDMITVLEKIRRGEPLPPLPSATPRPIIEIVHRALARKPSERYESAADMRQSVQFAYAEVCAPVPKEQFARFVTANLQEPINERRAALKKALREVGAR